MTTNSRRQPLEAAPEANPTNDTASSEGAAPRRPRYTLRPVTKPLSGAVSDAGGKPGASPRAENEDDDGYDPYSDYHDGTARALDFEADPWR